MRMEEGEEARMKISHPLDRYFRLQDGKTTSDSRVREGRTPSSPLPSLLNPLSSLLLSILLSLPPPLPPPMLACLFACFASTTTSTASSVQSRRSSGCTWEHDGGSYFHRRSATRKEWAITNLARCLLGEQEVSALMSLKLIKVGREESAGESQEGTAGVRSAGCEESREGGSSGETGDYEDKEHGRERERKRAGEGDEVCL
eukprot:759743-Hanusia_phi.AAC.1